MRKEEREKQEEGLAIRRVHKLPTTPSMFLHKCSHRRLDLMPPAGSSELLPSRQECVKIPYVL